MDVAAAARELNRLAYGYIGSWALLTACNQRLFDRLPASVAELGDTYPDPALVETWLRVLEADGLVSEADDGTWSVPEAMAKLVTGERSYSGYLGGQVLDQMTPRLLLGEPGVNALARALEDPASRSGYEAWFADADEAARYQESQYAGSLGPARTLARMVEPGGRVLDLGGGWGAMARSVAKEHDVVVDVVDLPPVVESAPPSDGVEFVAGDALDPGTWPDEPYDGVILSYLLSSVPGDTHAPLLGALAERDVSWVAVHDFLIGGGSLAPAWSLQHAVFVPGHVSRSVSEVETMLCDAGFCASSTAPVVDDMTTLVLASAA
ncbi:MAG: methyltransferase [Actinomycetota bacterium]|nr:methyltransferase [Actinomycetota bacterium]